MNLLYFLVRLSIAVALQVRLAGWVNPRVCRFVHSPQQVVSTPTTDDIRRYAVASQFAYVKEDDPSFAGSLSDLKQVCGEQVIYTPFFKDGTEKETDVKRQVLAGYIIQVNHLSNIETIVAFRGTKRKEWSEWKNNMDSIPVLRRFTKQSDKQSEKQSASDKKVTAKQSDKQSEKEVTDRSKEGFSLWIHRGITKEYDRCRLDFLKKIEELVQVRELVKKGELVFVGHSKGIISQLGALDFVVQYDRPFPIRLITFGAYKVFAPLPGGDDPREIFKKWGLHCTQVRFLRDPVVHYPFFRSCYQHVFDTRIYLKQPPNSLLEHSIYNYNRFFTAITPLKI